MRNKNRGFTLIEILVVITIISIVSGIIVFSIGDTRSREFDRETRRLQTVLQMASQEAVMQYQQLGVIIEPDGYQFVRLDEEQEKWVPFSSDDATFRNHKVMEGVTLEVSLDGMDSGLGSDIEELTLIDDEELDRFDDDEDEEVALQPQIYMLSSGELNDFIIYLDFDEINEHFMITGNLAGAIKLERADASEE